MSNKKSENFGYQPGASKMQGNQPGKVNNGYQPPAGNDTVRPPAGGTGTVTPKKDS